MIVMPSSAGRRAPRWLATMGSIKFGAVVFLSRRTSPLSRGLRDAMPVMPYAGGVYGVAALVLAPVAIVTQARFDGGIGTLGGWIAVVALGLIPTLVGHTLLQSVARRVSPAIAGLVCPGETAGSIAIGALFLGTRPTLREGVGTAIVLAGATLAVTGMRRS